MADATLRNLVFSVAIDTTGTGPGATKELRAGTVGKRWQIHFLYLEVGGATDISLLSGSTAVTGTFTGATTGQSWGDGESVILKGVAVGDAFQAILSANEDLDGWAMMSEADQ